MWVQAAAEGGLTIFLDGMHSEDEGEEEGEAVPVGRDATTPRAVTTPTSGHVLRFLYVACGLNLTVPFDGLNE